MDGDVKTAQRRRVAVCGPVYLARAGGLLHRTVDAIGRAIVLGQFAAGSVLPVEAELAARYGAGRNVVREAIKILGEKRLLRTERRSGTVVLPVADWNYLDPEVMCWTLEDTRARDRLLDDLTALREIIEPEVAARAACEASTTETLRLFEALEHMESPRATKQQTVAADILFHQRLFEASHNRLLLSLVRTVTVVLEANFALALQVKHEVPQYLKEHRAVANAIQRRDPDNAREVMRILLSNNARHLQEMRAQITGG